MKIKKSLWLIPAALALLIVVFFSMKRDRPRGIKLPNGTEIELVGVGYERTNTIYYGTPWRKFLHRILPPRLKTKAGLSTVTAQLWKTNSPVFFTHLYNEKEIHEEILAAAVFDEYGIELDGNGGGGSGSQSSSSQEEHRYWYRDIYGPHNKIAGLNLYADADKTIRVAELPIPNVPRKAFPLIYSSEPLKKSDGGLDVALTSFTTGWQSEPDPTRKNIGQQFSRITFVVSTKGRPASDWSLNGLQIATNGGKLSAVATTTGRRGAETVIDFRSTRTNISDLRLELIRHRNFSPEETHTFKDMPFPDAGEVIQTNVSVEIQGVRLILERIGSAGTTSGDEPRQPGQAYLQVRVSGPQKGINLWILKATDENGDELETAGQGSWKNGQSFHWFQPSAKAQKFNVTFCVHKTRFFEFHATPQVLTITPP
ncbi:MAG: hypothetical protein JWM68_3149 [Verrucomicrobiales bacterium]|nr:hypothetical protein [Verrucomicrobiales bacterium]